MSRLGAWAAGARHGPPEPPLLAAPRRDAAIAVVAAALTAAVFIVAADSSALAHIQHLDDAWLRLMLSGTFKLPSPSKVLLALGIIAAVVGLILATRRARRIAARTVLPRVRSALANLREVARHPGKLILLVGGSALVTLAYIGGLVMSVLAFRGPVSIAGIGAAYLAAAAIATASGTPGGVGTFEAVQTSLLIGIGISASVAVPAVITYRLATYWLPVAPGWAAFRLLQRREFV